MSEKRIRIFRYALKPTDIQKNQLDKCAATSRFLWNRFVKIQKRALREIKNGRRASIENDYINIISSKNFTGVRASIVGKLSKELNVNKDEALKIFTRKLVERDIKIPVNKTGVKLYNWAANHLSWRYAYEKVNSEKSKLLSKDISNILYGILPKWEATAKKWESGGGGEPRFKKWNQMSTIQKQISKSSNWKFGSEIDLSWCGSKCLENVEVILSRKIPTGAVVNQIALVKSPVGRWFVCLFLEAEESVFARNFEAAGGKSLGIDPGFKSALTTSEGEIIHPKGLSRQDKMEKKLIKLQRKLDRQRRLNNPDCYETNGTFKKKKRLHTISRGMVETGIEIAKIQGYFVNARADYYSNAINKILNKFDNIGVGDAKMHKLVRGVGKSKRAGNRIAREHAISDFISKLNDKASLSVNKKYVQLVNEAYTSCTCNICGEETKETKDTSVRKWTCLKCGTIHNRDVNGAINIRNKMLKDLSAGAQPVRGAKAPKVNRRTKVKPRSVEIDSQNCQGDVGNVSECLSNSTDGGSVRTSEPSVTERGTKVYVSVDSALPLKTVECSQSQTYESTTEEVKR